MGSPSTMIHSQSFSDGSSLFSDYIPAVNQDGIIRNICNELASFDLRPGEKSVAFVRTALEKLFLDPNIDLCSIFVPISYSPPDHTANLILELIDQRSSFFETIFDGSEQLANELWTAILWQFEHTNQVHNNASDSVMYRCIESYVDRLLPDSEPMNNNDTRSGGQLQRVRTPLDLFQTSSPILHRIKFDAQDSEKDKYGFSSNSIHPRHLTMYCNFVSIMCSPEHFPCVHRILILRYLLKQFHLFCLSDTIDVDLATIKTTVHSNPPFAPVLYNFLYTFLEQTPSVVTLGSLTDVWLVYCRPWRYEYGSSIVNKDCGAKNVSRTRWTPFIRNQEKFYRIILGKILRKFYELDITPEAKNLLFITEWVWKEPHRSVLRELRIDARPPTRRFLEKLSEMYRLKRNEIGCVSRQKKSLWDSFAAVESESLKNAKAIVNIIEPVLKSADDCMGTTFLNEAEHFVATNIGLGVSCAPQLSDTPKRGYLPDHEKDPVTGLMYLTPLGRHQVLNGQRKFDFSTCRSVLPNWMAISRFYECPPLVKLSKWTTDHLNSLSAVQMLAKKYPEDSVTGRVARIVMDPPCPNPMSPISSPVFSRTLRKVPPSLRIRVFANYGVLLLGVLLGLFHVFGWWIFVFVLLVIFGIFSVLASLE